MAVDYAKEREQFGRPIGAYQAVSHRLADMLWEVEEARSLTSTRPGPRTPSPRRCRSPPRWRRRAPPTAPASVTHNAIQTLGGIGFTWEHDVHFLLKRARVSRCS